MVNEDKKAEKIISKTAGEDSDEGDKSTAGSVIDRAHEAADRLKAENDRKEALLDREEQMAAKKLLGGLSSGPSKQPVKEETPEEYKNRVLYNK